MSRQKEYRLKLTICKISQEEYMLREKSSISFAQVLNNNPYTTFAFFALFFPLLW